LRAYKDCLRRKRKTANAAKFEQSFEKELLKLERELRNWTYEPGKSICFVVTQPKVREIFAADFRDRIVHHLLVNYLLPTWEKIFIFHSFACRQEKGSHLAKNFLKRFVKDATKNFSQPAYYLQMDIAAFFMSLNKEILFREISRHLKNPEILWLAEKIIFHDPTKNFYRKGNPSLFNLVPDNKTLFKTPMNQGLPIGNLTSQFFANIYLNPLDQFVKHELKAKYYLRYVDDFILIHNNQNQLKIWRKKIDEFLKEQLSLSLHPRKTVQQSIYKGINFVGFVLKPRHSLIRRRTVNNCKNKIKEFNNSPLPASAEIFKDSLLDIQAVINSYYGQFRQADTFNLRQALYAKHFGILKSYLDPSDKNFLYFVIKENLNTPRSRLGGSTPLNRGDLKSDLAKPV
jgi:hypothetical protein